MKKHFILIPSIIFILVNNLYSQSVSAPSIVLENIEFSISVSDLPDTLHSLVVLVINDDYKEELLLFPLYGKVDTVITVYQSGNYSVHFPGSNIASISLSVLPGILSIIPPLLAILLALIFRQVILSLILGVYIGAIFIYDYNPITGLLRLIDKYIINAVSDYTHIQILVFTLLFGGVIGLISKSGGTTGIANVITRFAKNRKSTMISAWFSGLAIFFDDYANTLIVGNLMRPVTDKMKISREKLAFIVDATAAPVASVFIISSWIGYEVGLIQDGLQMIASDANAYSTFIATIPYRSETSEIFGNEDKAKWYNGIIPILVIIIGTLAGLLYTGLNALHEEGITDFGIREIIGFSDSYLAVLWSSFAACIIAAILILTQKIMSLSETIDAWIVGIKSMLMALIILTLAWSIGAITVEMKTADYIISLISDTISPNFLPAIVFIVCALTSFATGTSWGTMAIMMPIVIPLSDSVTELYNFNPADSTIILNGVISSVLAGTVFGDHVSPISDTTILSSIGSGCDHVDHVRTQLPYAIVVMMVCIVLGDIPTAFGLSPYLALIFIAILLVVVVYTIGRKVEKV
ncbi:MAG: Na+/H+ antiporter NhaC family protein [Ignavibacteriaceae bacterium]